jgi:hypothetical protein
MDEEGQPVSPSLVPAVVDVCGKPLFTINLVIQYKMYNSMQNDYDDSGLSYSLIISFLLHYISL